MTEKQPITSIIVDLGKAPNHPFKGRLVLEHQGSGAVTLERLAEGLYLDGRKVVLWPLSNSSSDLRQEVPGQSVLNANVLDVLYEHPELIPDEWRVEGEIYFLGSIFEGAPGSYARFKRSWARYLDFSEGSWATGHWFCSPSHRESGWAAVLEQ